MAFFPLLLLLLLLTTHHAFATLDGGPQPQQPPSAAASDTQTYIVHVKYPNNLQIDHVPESMEAWYKALLDQAAAADPSFGAPPQILRSYCDAMTGFAAKLTPSQLSAISKSDWFLHAFPNRMYHMHTTHTPKFLGLLQQPSLWNSTNLGEGVIIGVLDSGVALNHPSFGDEGMSPPPAKWRGICESPVVCNNKLIGARSYVHGESPADEVGHGSHTSSTAAGNFVEGVNMLGTALGRAAGMAPRAHIAMYKVCSEAGCEAMDIIAGFGQAIRDGCDVISVSLGTVRWLPFYEVPFYEEPVALGSFAAIKREVFVSASAGNSGPEAATLSNEMPWVLTVAASTMDREIRATVRLGDGTEIEGQSLFQPSGFDAHMYPLVNPAKAGGNIFCGPDAFEGVDVKGKIVLCVRDGDIGRIDKGTNVKAAGGVGMILANSQLDGYRTIADPHEIAASHVGFEDGKKILAYIDSSTNPTATIVFKGPVTGSPRAPAITDFSSRGPSLNSPGILKPDITGPGFSVVAAWPTHINHSAENQALPPFNMLSGTSMSCPHLSGIAALIQAAHPKWPPSAVKSAIMTTAYVSDNKGGPIQAILDDRDLPADVFAFGAGHVDVTKASDPGLVYITDKNDYIPYLCGLNYTDDQVSAVANKTVNCSTVKSITEQELNYPSISLTIGAQGNSSVVVRRKVTNVGDARSVYWAEVHAPAGVSAVVKPAKLKFKTENQRKNFRITFTRTGGGSGYGQGYIKWTSKKHVVRSPISVKFV